MNDASPFHPPSITDEDIHRAAVLLGLRKNAFHGSKGDDNRAEVLKCMSTMDVEACPGSGKTTLLVAKLAILANKWNHRTRGICVLSHTNAARYEIEKRLGNTAIGRQLLSYPHYIGTIHGFVNEYMAIPWLHSLGYPITRIDNDEVEQRRRNLLNNVCNSKLRNYVSRKENNINIIQNWIITSPEFDVINKNNGKFVFINPCDSLNQLKSIVKSVCEAGYHCYDEMFIWASDLITKVPGILTIIRDRFPLLFMDEAQDNSEEQSKILHRIFMDGQNVVHRQRFGDSNQAIYNFVEAKGASTDTFPNKHYTTEIPDSNRFGEGIAQLAGPLSLTTFENGLKGNGPSKICINSDVQEGPHTIFLFDDDSMNNVLSAYAELLVKTFSEEELNRGMFTAVGQVHKWKNEGPKPRHVGHYWPEYDAELTKSDPQPHSFVQYIQAGMSESIMFKQTWPIAEKIAQAIIRLSGMTDSHKGIRRRKRCHRYVMELLDSDQAIKDKYVDLVYAFSIDQKVLCKESWASNWSKVAQSVAEIVAATSLSSSDAKRFIQWEDPPGITNETVETDTHRDNIYRYPTDNSRVSIKVGSVHSVKGQTHTATLVLETYWHCHNLESLLTSLLGDSIGKNTKRGRHQDRLKVHYVAMTRPTHLLCLAMKHGTFENVDGSLDEDVLQKLAGRGWNIKYLNKCT